MTLDFLSEGVPVDPERLCGAQFTTLLAGAIFNPRGPTILACSSVPDPSSASKKEALYFMMIHPFSQTCVRLGTADYSTPMTPDDLCPLHTAFIESALHQDTERMAFTVGWSGSVERSPAGQMMKNLGPVMSFDEMLEGWFVPIFLSCRVAPRLWPNVK
jgi:hypothetical protein